MPSLVYHLEGVSVPRAEAPSTVPRNISYIHFSPEGSPHAVGTRGYGFGAESGHDPLLVSFKYLFNVGSTFKKPHITTTEIVAIISLIQFHCLKYFISYKLPIRKHII